MKWLLVVLAAMSGVASAQQPNCGVSTLAAAVAGAAAQACSKDTGFSALDAQVPTGALLQKVCANANCKKLIGDLNAAARDECRYTLVSPSILYRADFLNKIGTACALPASGGQCGNDATGPLKCPTGEYCQPWNPSFYQCRRVDGSCGRQQAGMDYYGNDLAKHQLLLPEQCCAVCQRTAECNSYTFVNYNPDGKAYCYLKKNVGRATPKVGAVSATIAARPTGRQL